MRGIARTCSRDRVLTLYSSLPRDLIHALNIAVTCTRARDLVLAKDRAEARALSRGLARERERALNSARALDKTRGLALAFELEFNLGFNIHQAPEIIGADGIARALDLGREQILAFARERGRDLTGLFDALPADASDADLSRLRSGEFGDLDVLAGVLWNEATLWPPVVAKQIRARSEVVRAGQYRIRGALDRDGQSGGQRGGQRGGEGNGLGLARED